MFIYTALLHECITRVVITAAVAVALIFTINYSVMAQSGGGYDPLSQEELERALTAALQAGLAGGADSEISAAAIDQEVLLVERHQSKKSDLQSASIIRQGDVYVYDYNTDTLKHAIVNLNTNETIAVEEMQNVQLPLTEREVNRALDLIFENEQLRNELSSRYQSVTGAELNNVDQLRVKAFVFRADSMPDRVNTLSQECGIHRCAQVLLYTDDDTILEVQPIVDLSRQIVTQEITNNIVVEERLIANENIEETLTDLSSQNENADAVDAQSQTESAFLPFVGRNQFKDQAVETLTLEQQLFNLWCTIFSGTWVDALFGSRCS